jgi:hypothetical protein
MLYLISYDLKAKPEAEYVNLGAYLRNAGAVKILYSEWLLVSKLGAVALRDAITQHIAPNDKLWVMQLTSTAAWTGVLDGGPSSSTLKAMFEKAA